MGKLFKEELSLRPNLSRYESSLDQLSDAEMSSGPLEKD